MKKKIILILMTIIFLSLFVYSLIHIVLWFRENEHTEQVMEDIIEGSIQIINTDDTKEEKIDFDYLNKKK